MLSGEGAVAIWNGIADAGRADFYAWHLHEHMPERVGTPGFLRGRRYIAVDRATHPEFFTLYETQTFEVLLGQDYLNRLNAPTPWTKRATSHFLTTSRALTRVAASFGVGTGGALLTLRFDLAEEDAAAEQAKLEAVLLKLARGPEITGAHLLKADGGASAAKTNESRDRTDIEAPPRWIIMVEACSVQALRPALGQLRRQPALKTAESGRYRLEYTRLKTAGTAG
jgi:hypothetical protein